MNNSEYKKYHEMFMTNNQGSTAVHTFFCIFFTIQCSLFCTVKLKNCGLIQYIGEFLLIVLPTILVHTVLSAYIYELNLGIFVILLYEILKNYNLNECQVVFKSKNSCRNDKILSISMLRGLTYLITVICILAVDFSDFPRHLAKTESYGYSLMDTGVGLFVLMSGLVHKNINKYNYILLLKDNSRLVLILLLIGVTRYLCLKHFNYQEHLTEYGKHWNFFITLAVCKLLSYILSLLSSHSLLLSMLTLSIHELLLYNGLESWVFSDKPRTSFLYANREGIASNLGYVALYLFAASLKNTVMDKSIANSDILKKLFTSSFALIFISFLINKYRPPSRVLANAGYCIYISASMVSIFSVIYFLEILFKTKEKNSFNVPLILLAVNNNGLFYFLVANITTGLINMAFRTLFLSSFATLIILIIYKIFTLSLTIYVNKIGIKL